MDQRGLKEYITVLVTVVLCMMVVKVIFHGTTNELQQNQMNTNTYNLDSLLEIRRVEKTKLDNAYRKPSEMNGTSDSLKIIKAHFNAVKNEAIDSLLNSKDQIDSLRSKLKSLQAFPNGSSISSQCDVPNPAQRFDCHPEVNASQDICEGRGCCWLPVKTRTIPLHSSKAGQKLAKTDIPVCFYPKKYAGYTMMSRKETVFGFSAVLQRSTPSYYPNDVKTLSVEVMFEENDRLHVKIKDAVNERYEVPFAVPHPTSKATDPQYTVSVSQLGELFYLTVNRKSATPGSRPLFSTQGMAPLIYTDQFLQLSSVLASPYVYGIGERRGSLLLDVNWTRQTLWTEDVPPVEGANLYGSHPFYLAMEVDGKSNGFFLLNSNAMDVTLQPYPAVTWRTIGGILDFYILTGDSPAEVIRAYTDIIGKPVMPPYWALGFHICKFGYKSVNDTLKVTDRIRKAGIPLDVQWTDMDYAVGDKDFTTDLKRWGDQAALAEELHSRGMHYVINTDPGISSGEKPGSYRPYDYGMELDIFIKNDSGLPLVGKVWPGTTVWPDFLHPKAQLYWTTMIKEFHAKVSFDGLWIDMNEISSFVNGSVSGCPDNNFNNPPYLPVVDGGKLYSKTICPSALQYKERSYNVHNLYGLLETRATYNALREVRGRRPFIISRSQFAGQGHFGGHWSGDNGANFHNMYRSVSEFLSMNLLGIPLSGADICGFHFNATYKECLRWHQLGAFYPYSRNHNDMRFENNIPQDPAAFDDLFAASVRKVYMIRYSLLPFLYTLFHQSHVGGYPVARAMFYEFPGDSGSHGKEAQFMWGSSLLVIPVLQQDTNEIDVYLPPQSLWYNFYTGHLYKGTGDHEIFSISLYEIALFVQAGTILPMQEPALTTTDSRKNPFQLLVATGEDERAAGVLYWDDGDSLDTYERQLYNFIQFSLNGTTLRSTVIMRGYETYMTLGNITVFGCKTMPQRVLMNGIVQYFNYNFDTKVLTMPSLSPAVNLLQDFKMEW